MPFLMRWPAVIKAGRTCDEVVGQIDLLATCADVAGAKLPPDAGEDSYSLLAGMSSAVFRADWRSQEFSLKNESLSH